MAKSSFGGYTSYSRPKKSALAIAAAGGYQDPFGLSASRVAPQPRMATFGVAPAPSGDPTGSGQPMGQPKTPTAPNQTPPPPATVAAPTTAYDINTDPAFQQISGFLGKSDQQANDAARAQRQKIMLAYGDPNLARTDSAGGADLALAAGNNPTSSLAVLGNQRQNDIRTLTEYLNNQNLFYGGARITQEQQHAQDYQNALAGAAGGVDTALGTIDSNLAAALGQNQRDRIAATTAATDKHKNDPGPPGPEQLSVGGRTYHKDPTTGKWVADPGQAADPGPTTPPGTTTTDPTAAPFYVASNNAGSGPLDLSALLENKKRAARDALALALGGGG